MANPTQKSENIDSFITNIFGIDRKQNIMDGICVSCKSPATEFDSNMSYKEFCISGLCQKCQDKIFGAEY